ncbi:DEAD/DEAH box helicase [Aeromonas sanarellii]|uniref:DEAD/DEAH box helicase n=1 Tax=Aeromonas sanarellii TaxID=633415 RepID=UPI0039A19814
MEIRDSQLELLPGSIEIEHGPAELFIWSFLKELLADEKGILGYRVLPLGHSDLSEVPSFLVITESHGIIIVDVCSDQVIGIDEPDYWIFKSSGAVFSRDAITEFYYDEAVKRLKKSSLLYDRRKRELLFPINRVIVFYSNNKEEVEGLGLSDVISADYVTCGNIEHELNKLIESYRCNDAISIDILDTIYAQLEGTSSFEYRKPIAHKCDTVNDYIQKSLSRTFKQDRAQRQISMQLPNGPQRIRGLAGTGKTVVLALKTALTHFRFKDFKILYLFNTQSLYNQIEGLVRDYYTPEAGAIPNWDNIDILHAWGGASKPGLYYNLCVEYGLQPLTWNDVRRSGDGLSVIYTDILNKIGDQLKGYYDVVLIDEAQDFPQPLFEVVYKITKDPKRIIWAYDEFQSLRELKIREPEELFGVNEKGVANIKNSDLKGVYEGGIKKDFILPNCYRNPRQTLMVAHGIALGIYSRDGLVDSIDSATDWNALGYEVISPEGKTTFEEGDAIVIDRPATHSQNRLELFLHEDGKSPRNLLKTSTLSGEAEQAKLVADEITRLINTQGVSPEEIIVITLGTRTAEEILGTIRVLLNTNGIKAITPGIVEKSSAFKEPGFVTLTTPFRAKGNESNVVFVVNCQKVYEDFNFRGRNAFFVSVTRSRGWCYLYGQGANMDKLAEEIMKIRDDYPQFKYTRPDDETIKRRRVILSKTDREIEETTATIDKLLTDAPEILIEQLKLKGLI